MSREAISAQYARFATDEARGRSPRYEHLAAGLADSEPVLDFLEALPPHKRQPNLLLAALRYLGHDARHGTHVEGIVRDQGERLRRCILSHATQTNEPGRCAALLPALCALPRPLALLEVGASAGLCLLPDHYAYDYGRRTIAPASAASGPPPVLRCVASAKTPLPDRVPHVVWRAGIDLAPVDLSEEGAADWLRALVWPDQPHRAQTLERAIRIARAVPLDVVAGDLVECLPDVAASAPSDATLVVFHSATLVYLAPEDRARFVAAVGRLKATWISNEAPSVLPDLAAGIPDATRRFVLAANGRPMALTGPHGESIDWLA